MTKLQTLIQQRDDARRLEELERNYKILQARAGHVLPFTKITKPDYEVNWHHRLLADKIDRFLRKEIRFLMVFMPPRHGKSELTSRRAPALCHGLYPNDEILAASYNGDFASDFTVDVQRIVDSPMFHEIFPTIRIPPPGGHKGYARNSSEHEIMPYQDPADGLWYWYRGSYRSGGVGGSMTGLGGNWIFLDDLIKNREDADSPGYRDKMQKWYTSTVRTRLEKNGSILMTLTRWHDDDLPGRLLKLAKSNPDADQWHVITLPAVRETLHDEFDPRLIGEPLWESKYDLKELAALKAAGHRDWSALYQQSPIPEGGNIIKADWIKYYKSIPTKFDTLIQSWDFAVKAKESSSFTVGSVYGKIGADKFLVAQVRGQWDFPTQCNKVIELSNRYPKAHKKLFEDKGNGPAVKQTLGRLVSGITPIEPSGDKVARLNAVAPEYQSGNVWYPDPSIAPWISDHLAEMVSFPSGAYADRVDAESQALDELRRTGPALMPIIGHSGGSGRGF